MEQIEGSLKYLDYLQGHSDQVAWLAVGETDGTEFVVSGAMDSSIIKWKLDKNTDTGSNKVLGTQELVNNSHSGPVNDLWISNDSRYILSASADKTLNLWKLEDNIEACATFTDHQAEVVCWTFSKDNRVILSAGNDSWVKIWNVLGVCKYTQSVPSPTCVAFTGADQEVRFAVGWNNGDINIYNSDMSSCVISPKEHSDSVSSLDFNSSTSWLISSGEDRKVVIYDCNDNFSKSKY